MVSNNNNVARVKLASFVAVLICVISLMSCACASTNAQLTSDFYARTCPRLHSIVHDEMRKAVLRERRMAASILRLFFHDCFVNGCDGSVLLDDTDTFTGEQNAFPNQNSARGFEVIDTIKSRVEAACPATVSCADILALASRDGVELVGGQSWKVRLGRRDARTASQAQANSDLPSPFVNLSTLISMFAAKGLNAQEMTVLSGAHTIGFAQCGFFKTRIYNETNIDPLFAAIRRRTFPVSGGDSNLTSIDTSTPNLFDNSYYWNLVNRRGLFHSDQELFNGGSQDNIVRSYSVNPGGFARDFANAR